MTRVEVELHPDDAGGVGISIRSLKTDNSTSKETMLAQAIYQLLDLSFNSVKMALNKKPIKTKKSKVKIDE